MTGAYEVHIMKYNRYIACMVNKDENSLFGFISVIDDTMMNYMVSAIQLFENIAQLEYNVDKYDVMVEVIDYNSIAYHAMLSYNDRAQWSFEHMSSLLIKAFVNILVNESQYYVAEKLLQYACDNDF